MKRITYLLVGLAALAACGERAVTESESDGLQPGEILTADKLQSEMPSMQREGVLQILRELERVRQITAPFHNIDRAKRAGWSTQITDCMVDPAGSGGMGFHFGNTQFIDGTAQVDQPAVLLYEPEPHGRMRLVAVEYVIPYTFHSRDAEPPVLFGQKFQQNDAFQLWGLHAWIWKANPSGVFANWNPRVNCRFATSTTAMSH
ncbi:MAG TPA: hypothetical protein VJO33_00725 [Gemmatimonadaceae bacterium]|nr:hypothetical protein [Gemmatimonadaceae bacterium]